MPKPAPSMNSTNLKLRSRNFLFKIFLPWACLGFIAFIIFEKSKSLVVRELEEKKAIVTQHSEPKKQSLPSPPTVDKTVIETPVISNEEEWCEVEKYEDLSKHSSIVSFEKWLVSYEEFECYHKQNCDHDPRIKWDLLFDGLKKAKERKEIFKRIMRSDPRKALELAINEDRIKNLPKEISVHLEKWVSSYSDIKAVHICKDPKRPMGMIKRFATLPDGQMVEAYTYGERKYLKSTQGMAIWGVQMGEEMVISENPYQIKPSSNPKKPDAFVVKMADMQLEIPSSRGLEVLKKRVVDAERQGSLTGRVRYPLIASSTGAINLIDLRYTVFTNRLTWKQAQQVAFEKNATLVNINSQYENSVVYNLLSDAAAIGLMPFNESNDSVKYSWIGASDSEDANGSFYSPDTNQTTFLPNLLASEGTWKWQDGTAASFDLLTNPFLNWKTGTFTDTTPDPDDGQDYGAMDFNDQNGYWIDLNESFRLPYILEFPQQAEVLAPPIVDGRRKVLVIPSRFRDEGNDFLGSSSNPTDQFGNPLNPNYSNNAFEPFTRASLINAMEGVKEFYLRNSDGSFILDYVLTPTVTLDIPKYERVAGSGDPNIFDSTGQFYQPSEIQWNPDPELAYFGAEALIRATELSRLYDYGGPAFQGVLKIKLQESNETNSTPPLPKFPKPPVVRISGGNEIGGPGGILDPDFEEAQAVAKLDENGTLYEIEITNPGAFYHSIPKIELDGVDFTDNFIPILGRTVVSWVSITSYGFGAPGVGYVGAPGSHVKGPNAGTIVHELGHNFGLWHANRKEGEGLRPNSDEGISIDYGNPYSVMGTGGASMDFTISSKVYLNSSGSFGLKSGTESNASVDVVDLNDSVVVANSGLDEPEAVNPNTFRVYRHDYGSAPYPLVARTFELDIPSGSKPATLDSLLNSQNLQLFVGGPGEDAEGYVKKSGNLGYQLVITKEGKGFSEEPAIAVLNDQNISIIDLDSSWIKLKSGSSENYIVSSLRDFSDTAHRGLRGLEVAASQYSPRGFDVGTPLLSYWVAYRRNISEYGLTIINGTNRAGSTWIENTLLDMTPNTQGFINNSVNLGDDFRDAFLLLGRSFSDYEADSHITPIRKGGIPPMEYIEVVVNVGTVKSGVAKAPKFDLVVSNTKPSVNEIVEFTVITKEGNSTDYAYAWYNNEVAISDPAFLNNKTFSKKFTSSGYQVIKVIVSDLKGGISSKNVTIQVGNAEESMQSVIQGRVKSSNGAIQGAKVVLSKAKVIEHSVRVSGSLEDSRINSTYGNNLKFIVDSEEDAQLVMHRGEIHRFVFDSSTRNYPLSFFQTADHEPAKIKLNLLFRPSVEEPGDGYTKPPHVELLETSRFDSVYSTSITSLDLFTQNQIPASGTFITKPSAKSLLSDTNVSRIIVRPVKVDQITGLPIHFGGRGMNRDNPPPTQVLRTSYWEDYNDANATATSYIDGVGTITHSNTGGSGYPSAPDVVIFGAGSEANYTSSIRAKDGKKDPAWKKSNILQTPIMVNQGIEYDPNSTLAVALYPTEPIAYWSFNHGESLFEDGNLKPTSGFNLPIDDGLVAYWKMDEENATTFPVLPTATSFSIDDNSTTKNLITVSKGGGGALDSSQRSFWGTKNRSLTFAASDSVTLTQSSITDSSTSGAFTFSCWVQGLSGTRKMEIDLGDFNLTISGNSLSLKHPINGGFVGASPTLDLIGKWIHLLVKYDGSQDRVTLFINGEARTTAVVTPSTGKALNFQTGFQNILLDEVMVYNRALSDSEVAHLAGNIFLDLSGNKYNAVARGTGFEMNSTGNSGSVSNSFSTDLGEAISMDGNTSQRYLDLTAHLKPFSGLDIGTIAFWIKPHSLANDSTILSASCTDDNQSFFRLLLRDNGKIRTEAYNDGTEYCKLSSGGSATVSAGGWSHVAILIGANGISYYIDGKSVPVVVPPNSANSRAFFADIENLNYFAIGRHETKESNATDYFNGQLDEVQIFDRTLTTGEIQYLFNLGKQQHVVRAILKPEVDSIGTILLNHNGVGYKEVPDVDFNTSFYSGVNGFSAPAGDAELNGTSVDQILLTKDFDNSVEVILPDNRKILRMSAEYVMTQPDGANRAVVPVGLFGYSSPPNLILDGSPTWPTDRNATGYPMFFLDANQSGEVLYGGAGYETNSSRYIHSFTNDSNSTTYEIIKRRMTWRDAAEIAALRGGKLVEINGLEENKTVIEGLQAAQIDNDNTVAPDGGGGAYLWIGGNDFATEGNWTWDGKNEGNGTQFWDGNTTNGTGQVGVLFNNWGEDADGQQSEPDDFNGMQDALAISNNGWPLGFRGQWNDLDENNKLYFIIEYNGTINDVGIGVGFESDAVRIFGEGYRPPEFEAKISQGRVDAIVLKRPGEGYYDSIPSLDNLYFIGDDGNSNPAAPGTEINPLYSQNIFIEGSGSRRNTDPRKRKGDAMKVHNGINLHDELGNRGSGWLTPPTIFADWGDETWQGHVGVQKLAFGTKIQEAVIKSQGSGYMVPLEITVVDGRSRPSHADPFAGFGGPPLPEHPFLDTSLQYREATFDVNETDENGSILDLNITFGGTGYEPTTWDPFLNQNINNSGIPKIMITGGGGMGAVFNGLVDVNGAIYDVERIDGGRGYFNFDQNNFPKAIITPNPNRAIKGSEKNASLHVSLGGSLKEPTLNNTRGTFSLFDGFMTTTISGDNPTPPFSEFRYAAPWVMILDKGRPESSIAAVDRAHAVAQVVDGNITKIVVTDGGNGYVDPHIVICGTPPQYSNLNDGKSWNAWQWRCNNLREDVNGTFKRCGHVDTSSSPYPPEFCPGEDVGTYRTDTNWDNAFNTWTGNHNKNNNHPNCPLDSEHRKNQFLSPVCSGKKANFVLVNDFYRAGFSGTYESWLPFETNCTAILEQGQIKEIKIINKDGGKYLAPEIKINGRGRSTEPIPIFDEQGILTRIFYNDPAIKNLELDKVKNPIGAGHGFSYKPWAKDDRYTPAFGPAQAITCTIFTDILFWDPPGPIPEYEVYDFNYTLSNGMEMVDPFGDRISNIRVLEGGLYESGDFNVTLDFNGSIVPDLDKNGLPDFVPGLAGLITTNQLVSFELDSNGTYFEELLGAEGQKLNLWRNTFLAEPDVKIFDELNGNKLSNYTAEINLAEIRLNGVAQYDPISSKSFLDIVVDNDLPSNFFYGLGNSDRSGMGGEILVYDGMPGYNWGQQNDWDSYAFTDENGTYVIPNLEPGLYNIAVFIEDENFQDIALRPDSDPSLFSQVLYVPGFDSITLETDNRGNGRSRLVWGQEARNMSRFATSGVNSLKVAEGIGGGFEMGKSYQFRITAASSNTSQGTPNISHQILSDGSLRFTINDDANSSVFDPDDRYTISFSSIVSGVDFTNTVNDGIMNNSFWGGDKAAINLMIENNQSLVLNLSPQSGNSLNSIEAPIRCESDPNASKIFTFSAYDVNGSPVDCAGVIWSLSLDQNITNGKHWDGNHSKVAKLESPQYFLEGNSSFGFGYYYPLYRRSIYSDSETNGTGVYNPADTSLTAGYHVHNFTGLTLPFYMNNGNMNHAVDSLPPDSLLLQGASDYNETSQIKLILHSGLKDKALTLTATLNGQSVSTRIEASKHSTLSEEELWYDQYFDTILKDSISTADEDNDTLSLAQEWQSRTNPLNADTDGDGLRDEYEINISKTNPRSGDTDGDGFSDNTEISISGLDPLSYNNAPPLPIITALNLSGSIISVTAGNKVTLGAEATETSLTGVSTKLPVLTEGNFSQVVSLVGQEWIVNDSAPSGIYHITYRATDSLKRTVELTQALNITAIDVTKPIISLSNPGPIYVLKGTSFVLPTVTAFDEQDGVLSSSVVVAGKSMLDVNKTGTYQINYSVSDAAGNTANLSLNVVVEDFAFTLNGKAIDGYLTGSTVIFDGKADVEGFDGLHDLNRTIQTDGSGSFTLQLTPSELSAFDLNNNNLLDASEGRIIVAGGYDSTLESNFTGRYQTDANSSVVSPLSTLVTAVMDQGLSKEEAKTKVATAFGLPANSDPTNYDPIAASLAGETSSSQFLLATARMANAMKQADALGSYLSVSTSSPGQVSASFVAELAKSLSNSLISSNPLDDSSVINQALVTSLQNVQSSVDVSQVSSAVTLLESADNLLVQTVNSGGEPNVLAVSLAKNQQAVDGAIINNYSDPTLTNLSTLAASATTSAIQSASNAITSINVFPPIAQNFDSIVRRDSWSAGSLVVSINASDGDGDTVLYSITSSNFDLDADGQKPFTVSSSGALSINDVDDLLPYAGSIVNVNLSLSDGKGMSTTISGALSIDNKLSLESTPVPGKVGWSESSWLKTFYSPGSSWLFHPAHTWLYVSPDNADGYWFWDSGLNIWWWTKPTIYPYFYRSNGIWNYWHFNGNNRLYFDYQLNSWITP